MDFSSETQDLVDRGRDVDSEPKPVGPPSSKCSIFLEPLEWIQMLCRELNGSFVLGVVLVYGLSQGFAGSFFRVVTDYYWKDVQKVQPSAVQMYTGFYYITWVMKPVWGVLTDVFPMFGYRRRPYFILAGILGASIALIISMYGKLPIVMALLCLVGMAGAIAITDVTIDACIARNSIERPLLAPDMQSLCGFVSSVGALIGYLSSGVFMHLLGAQGALGITAIPPALLVILGFVIFELRTNQQSVKRKFAGNRYLARNGAKTRQIGASLYPVSAYPSTRIDTALFIRDSAGSVFINIIYSTRGQREQILEETALLCRLPDR